MTKTKRIHISLPAELLRVFDKACKKSYTTRSEAIKRMLMMVIDPVAKDTITIAGITFERKK